MIPSCAAVAENIKKTVDAMAEEIGRRYYEGGGDATQIAFIKNTANAVILDWFLGDWLPPASSPSQSSAASNAPEQDEGA